jgi:predicted RNase H-like nuclease (RuvC/YqgF family)
MLNTLIICRAYYIVVIVAVFCILVAIPISNSKSTQRLNEQLWSKISETYDLSQMKEKRIRVLDDKILELREASLTQKYTIEHLQNELRECRFPS